MWLRSAPARRSATRRMATATCFWSMPETAEEKFVEDGFGVQRFDVMYNDFIIVGPPADPAGIAGLHDAKTALRGSLPAKSAFRLPRRQFRHPQEGMALWRKADIDAAAASGTWYRETGSGMGATLNVAVGMSAYALTDRGTWISLQNKGAYRILVEGD